MATNIDITQARIYVGTYAKYDNGSLEGKWLELSDYSDIQEFYEACQMLHKDEKDPEYMFQDWEDIPEVFIREYSLSEKFFAFRDALEELSQTEANAFQVWCDNNHSDITSVDVDDLMENFRDEFEGEYNDEEDFARWYLEQTQSLSQFVLTYFDYEAYARDLFSGSFWFSDGFVFRNY